MPFIIDTGPNPPPLVDVQTPLDPPDLLSSLPPFEQNSRDIQGVLTAIGNELARVEAARQDLIANYFPGSAKALLHFFEQLLTLPINPPLPLAERQQTVQAFMQHLKASGTGLDWEDVITALIGNSWNYQEHDPANVGSPAAYTVLVRLPYSTPVPIPASVVASQPAGAGSLSGTYFWAVTAITAYGETTPSTPISFTSAPSRIVHLAWTAQAPPTTGFNVYRGVSAGTLEFVGTTATNSFNDNGSAIPGAAPPTEDSSGSTRASVALTLLRAVTPANLVIEVGLAPGFIVGVSDIGIDAL